MSFIQYTYHDSWYMGTHFTENAQYMMPYSFESCTVHSQGVLDYKNDTHMAIGPWVLG